MTTFNLYNLDVGDSSQLRGASPFQVGPFNVTLVENYPHVVSQLHQEVQIQTTVTELNTTHPLQNVTWASPRGGGWHVSATATLNGEPTESSVLARSPNVDGGVWDLCQILTFLSGRHVVTQEMQEFSFPDQTFDRACEPYDIFIVAELAWRNRMRVYENELAYALLLENAAKGHRAMQVRAFLHNVVLNLLVDKWPREYSTLTRPLETGSTRIVLDRLAVRVTELVDSENELSQEAKNAYKALIRSRIMQGPSSMHDAVVRFLRYDLGIIPLDNHPNHTRRVQFLNRVRNAMIHKGQMPDLPGVEQNVADRYTPVIVAGVVPLINQLALGRLFGIDSLCSELVAELRVVLQQFFLEGNWRGHPLDLMDFEEWLNSPEPLV